MNTNNDEQIHEISEEYYMGKKTILDFFSKGFKIYILW